MTMKEIDVLRDRANLALTMYRFYADSANADEWRWNLQNARDEVEAALRVWWEQGCQPPPTHTDLMVTPESIDAFLAANPPDQGCSLPPTGWYCSREPGHEGPCAAYPIDHGIETCECGLYFVSTYAYPGATVAFCDLREIIHTTPINGGCRKAVYE